MRTNETTISFKEETRNILRLQTTIVILHVMTELVSKRNNSTNLHLSLGDSICPWRLRRPVGIFLFPSDDVFLFLPPVPPSRFFVFPIFFALIPRSSFRGVFSPPVLPLETRFLFRKTKIGRIFLGTSLGANSDVIITLWYLFFEMLFEKCFLSLSHYVKVVFCLLTFPQRSWSAPSPFVLQPSLLI